MKTKFLHAVIGISALLAAGEAKADYFEIDWFRADGYQEISQVSDNGIFTYGRGPVYVGKKDSGLKVAGDRNYTTTGVNDSGNILGISFGIAEDDDDFAFYTPSGRSTSQLIHTSPDIVTAALNPANKIAVVEKEKISFFNAPVGSAVPVFAASVKAGTGQTFTDQRRSFLRSSGELLVLVSDLGTPKYGLVKQSGAITIYPSSVLPSDASIVRETQPGKILFYLEGVPYESDLVNAPVRVFPKSKTNIVATDWRGTKIGGDVSDSLTSGFPTVDYPTFGTGNLQKFQCFLPKKLGMTDFYLNYVTKSGSLVGRGYAKNHNGDPVILTPTEEKLVSFCPRVSLKVLGNCKNKLKLDGNYLSGKVNKNTRCELEVSIKDSSGKPLAGKSVVTNYGKAFRGVTGRDGKMRFKFLVGEWSSFNLEAPYGDKKYYSESFNISVN